MSAESELAARQRFEALFRSHHEPVVRYVARRVRPEGVEDVVAETFLVAWRRLSDIPDDVLPWLLGVARRTLATQRRSAMRRGSLAGKIAATGPPLEIAEPASELGAAVTDALTRLGAKDREAITLIAWDELTPAQAAVALGQTGTAFRVRLHRAKRRLRRELDQDPRVQAGTLVGPLLDDPSEC